MKTDYVINLLDLKTTLKKKKNPSGDFANIAVAIAVLIAILFIILT